MIDVKLLRKTQIILKKDKKELTPIFFEEKEKNAENTEKKYFYRGCKHTLEKHYTEAIKWFQLVNDKDAVVMILLNAYKLGDRFLFDEYYSLAGEGSFFEGENIKPFLKKENVLIPVDIKLLKELKKQLEE
jgi:phosphoglycolate phosphatase-like HAD superfamily hydrolase